MTSTIKFKLRKLEDVGDRLPVTLNIYKLLRILLSGPNRVNSYSDRHRKRWSFRLRSLLPNSKAVQFLETS